MKKYDLLCITGENGKSELLFGQSTVWEPGSVNISPGGSGGSGGGSLHCGSHCAHHSLHIQVQKHRSWTKSLHPYIYLIVLITSSTFIYLNAYLTLFNRRKSKQAMRDYKKVQIQLENLETSVRDCCKKEFTGIIHHSFTLTFTKPHHLCLS